MRIHPGRALTALAVAGTVSLTAAACGGGTPSQSGSADAKTVPGAAASSAPADPFAGKTATQIVTDAEAAMTAAKSIKLKGSMTESGDTVSIDMTMVGTNNCQGTIDLGSQGKVTMVALGKTVWMKLDKTALTSLGAAAASVEGKYIKTSSDNKDFADLASFCDLKTFANSGTKEGHTFTKGAVVTVDGQQALTLVDSTDKSSVLVSLVAPYRVIRIMGPTSTEGAVTLTYDGDAKITPPPASEVVDGSKYGM